MKGLTSPGEICMIPKGYAYTATHKNVYLSSQTDHRKGMKFLWVDSETCGMWQGEWHLPSLAATHRLNIPQIYYMTNLNRELLHIHLPISLDCLSWKGENLPFEAQFTMNLYLIRIWVVVCWSYPFPVKRVLLCPSSSQGLETSSELFVGPHNHPIQTDRHTKAE